MIKLYLQLDVFCRGKFWNSMIYLAKPHLSVFTKKAVLFANRILWWRSVPKKNLFIHLMYHNNIAILENFTKLPILINLDSRTANFWHLFQSRVFIDFSWECFGRNKQGHLCFVQWARHWKTCTCCGTCRVRTFDIEH